MSIKAYQRAATQAESPRELEYRALGQVTAGLMRLTEGGSVTIAQKAEAIDENRRLWSLFASDCSLPQNQLPLTLRAQVISLAMWVARYSRDVLRDGASIEPLIDVNRSMMEGLVPRQSEGA